MFIHKLVPPSYNIISPTEEFIDTKALDINFDFTQLHFLRLIVIIAGGAFTLSTAYLFCGLEFE